MFDAIFFDLDGTLVDTESLALTSGLWAFAEVGHPVDATFMHGLVGKAEPQAELIILQALPKIDLTAFRAAWQGAGAPLPQLAVALNNLGLLAFRARENYLARKLLEPAALIQVV